MTAMDSTFTYEEDSDAEGSENRLEKRLHPVHPWIFGDLTRGSAIGNQNVRDRGGLDLGNHLKNHLVWRLTTPKILWDSQKSCAKLEEYQTPRLWLRLCETGGRG